MNRQIAFRTYNGAYVCAESGGGRELVANRTSVGPWETFTEERVSVHEVAYRSHDGHYIACEVDGALTATRTERGAWETFTLVGSGIEGWTGKFWRCEGGGGSTITCEATDIGPWEQFQIEVLSGPPLPPSDLPARVSWGDNAKPLATFGMGGFRDSSEFPGQPAYAQRDWIKRWVAEGYTHVQVAIVNGDLSRGRAPYDGLGNPECLRETLRLFAQAKLIPMLVLFQGARPSWDMLCTPTVRGYYNAEGREQFGYSNEWADANLAAWSDAVLGMWWTLAGHTAPNPYFVLGYECDEGFYDIANPDNRGMVEKYGFAAYRDIWARQCAEAGFFIGIHYLTDTAWPKDGQGGRDWGGPQYYQRTHFNMVLVQTAADDTRPQGEQLAVVQQFQRDLAHVRNVEGDAILVCGAEYGQEGGNEARAKQTGRLMLAGGSDGACFG